MQNLIAQVKIDESISWGTGTIGTKFTSISSIISMLLKFSLSIAGVIFIGILIFGGYKIIMSAGSGDQKQAAQSKTIITNAVIGLVIVFATFLIIQLISTITGFDILNFKP